MPDLEKIWLMPEQCEDPEYGRMWAPDNVADGCPDEDTGEELPWVPYVRQDICDAEIERLRKCCTQRGARMWIMKEWMENFEAGSFWTGSVWDALCEIKNGDVWFYADGAPR